MSVLELVIHNVTLGFGLSMILFCVGQGPRILFDILDISSDRY